GTGTGIFLEHLQGSGFACVVGVEPSLAAIAAAAPHRRAWIREGMFREQDFAPASFDLVCCFMTLEHVRDPAQIADAAFRLLRPGGAFVSVTHDYQSPVNRLLGRRSPIIDIEHMQLFNRRSAVELLRRSGYERVSVAAFRNRYALRYWMRLTPLPARLKGGLLSMLRGAGLDGIKIGLNVGNAMAAGFKP
ncbi:MAG TPA: class I SAM-dependent methyltransferase, partial [Ramlibacter sp.]|nr:class I SAM-dependent methyltransferase [Ramlibacter sp.]